MTAGLDATVPKADRDKPEGGVHFGHRPSGPCWPCGPSTFLVSGIVVSVTLLGVIVFTPEDVPALTASGPLELASRGRARRVARPGSGSGSHCHNRYTEAYVLRSRTDRMRSAYPSGGSSSV